jgi:2-methylisocitrate lyase-like PEP mutase family enzyme
VRLLGEAGAAGCSIEDWDPAAGAITPLPEAVARVEAAAGAAADVGMVLTARCEHHIHEIDDLDATIERLVAYRDAGAEVVYAPGGFDVDQARRIVAETATAVNCLLTRSGPSVAELAGAGVRRVSLGSALSNAAYAALVQGARHVLDDGTLDEGLPRLRGGDVKRSFGKAGA